jgi:hypothetical protein
MLDFAVMKLLVLAAMLAWGFAPQAAKPASSGAVAKSAPVHTNSPTTAKKTDSAPAQSPAISIVPDDQAARAASGPSDLDVKMTWFAGTLAAVAVLQFFALLWQTFSLRKLAKASNSHTQEMEYQSRVLDGQLKVMSEQLAAVKETANASSMSATAAKESIERIISKERARLRVELQPFYLNFEAPSPAGYTIQHEGSTDAFVVDSHVSVYVSPSRDPDRSAVNGRPMPVPSVIGAQNPVVAAQDVLHPFTPQEIEEIRQLKSFVHFTGFIRYKDVFEGEHETRFNRVWSIARMNHLNGQPFTYWEHCGTAEENVET